MSDADDRDEARAVWSEACFVAPSPELKERWVRELSQLRDAQDSDVSKVLAIARQPRQLGLDDGVIIPPSEYPVGTPFNAIRQAAADRAPLRGTVRVIVVLVDFTDAHMAATTAHFNDLFFSTGVLPHGSVKEYYRDVTGNLVDLTGEVVGPFRMPQTLAWYANGNFGIGRPSGTTRARDMALHAFQAANPTVNFGPYDNDGNGFVDAFIVVHAASGGEQSGNSGHIWSHKWVLASEQTADSTKVYAYLTIPEDAKLGVCAHELGHLLFGFPDLYDIDDTSEGIGNWCLMAGGSWNGGGDIPSHPSAWCKANQGWATVTNVSTSGAVTIPDVKTSRNLLRLWKDGGGGSEYFLLENRQRTGYDANLPGDGLLVWHIDEAQTSNSDETHYKVALMQADNLRDMELNHNRGDAGDPYPGSASNVSFTSSSTPSSRSYAGADTCVSVSGISASSASMTATISVSCGKGSKETKELVKDGKDFKDRKEIRKETKDFSKERKDFKDRKELVKEGKDFSKEGKDLKDRFENKRFELPGGRGGGFVGEDPSGGYDDGGSGADDPVMAMVEDLAARVSALEGGSSGSGTDAEAFIGSDLRPDLLGGPVYSAGSIDARLAAGDPGAKRELDAPNPR
jgi:immune inhibitor A